MKIIAFMLLFSILLLSCRNVETQSPALHYKIVFADNSDKPLKLFVKNGAEQYEEIIAVENIYEVDIPAMGGGYSEFMGFKFNKHSPEKYQILRIMKNDEIVQEFSVEDIEQLKTDENGNILLTLKEYDK